MFRSLRAALAWLSVALVAAVGLAACSSGSDAKSISLVGYSVPKPAYDALAAAFAQTDQGKGVTVKSSYGASGDQSRAVAGGQSADYVTFSTEPDMTKLVPKFVDASWNATPTKGMITDSVVVIVTRKGNPLHITGWDDLIKPGVKIVTPDPGSSGSAKWNILAAYTHVLLDGGTDAQASAYLTSFFKNVVAKPTSGSAATSTFLSGTGDVLISYEDEAIGNRQKNAPIDYLVPDETMLIENPAAVTLKASQAAKDFLAYTESEAGQKIFASKGFRPVLAGVSPGTVAGANDPANPFPTPPKLETIAALGGWTAVNTKFFDPNTGIVTKIEAG